MKKILTILLFLTISMSLQAEELKHDGYIIKYKTFNNNLILNENAIPQLHLEFVKELPKNIDKYQNVEYFEPNYIVSINHTPSDASYSKQWAPKKIDAEKAWDVTLGTKDIIVAVIDTGVDHRHKELKRNMWVNHAEKNGEDGKDDDGNGYIDDVYGYDFANNDGDPVDDHNHGTHCAGVIGAVHNTRGIAGLSSKVKIMGLKFLTNRGGGTIENAIKSTLYAVDNGAHILSNSWGGGGYSQAMHDAITYAKNKGVVFVAASGNSNTDRIHYPSGYDHDNVVSVASSDERDNKSSFSNYGLPHVDIAAPGSNIYSLLKNNGYGFMSGTSMATPQVSGALALMLSHKKIDYKELIDRLYKSSDYLPEIWGNYVTSSGRLNMGNLLLAIEPHRPAGPDPKKWVKHQTLLESPHPYANEKQYKYQLPIPSGSKYVRVHFEKLDTEANYDIVEISVGANSIEYSGLKESVYTKSISVNQESTIDISLKTDRSVVKWGFKTDFFEYQ